MMSWGGHYPLPGANHGGVNSQNIPTGMPQTAVGQYAMASNAVNYAQANYQHQYPYMQQHQQFNSGHMSGSMMPQNSGQQFQQPPYSASWPLVDDSSGTSSNNNAPVGLFSVGAGKTPGGMVQLQTNHRSLSSPDINDQLRKRDKSLEIADHGDESLNPRNQPHGHFSGPNSNDQPIRKPQGHGWPKSMKGRKDEIEKLHDNIRRGDSSTCPICQEDVLLDDWVSHATSHADPRERNDGEDAVDSTSQHRKSASTPGVDYLFIQDLLKEAVDNPGLLEEFSCEFCNVRGLFFGDMLKHIQEPEHMHDIYRWISFPSSKGHTKYKEHVPDVPIKSRHLKFHFCEVCLKLAGWHQNDIAKHINGKAHVSKIQKMRENLEWVQRGYNIRSEMNQSGRHEQERNQKPQNVQKLPAPNQKPRRETTTPEALKHSAPMSKASDRQQPPLKEISVAEKSTEKQMSKKPVHTSKMSKKSANISNPPRQQASLNQKSTNRMPKQTPGQQQSQRFPGPQQQNQQYPPQQQQFPTHQQQFPQQQQQFPQQQQQFPQQQQQFPQQQQQFPQQQQQFPQQQQQFPQQQQQFPPNQHQFAPQQNFNNRGMQGQVMPMEPRGLFQPQITSSQSHGQLTKDVFVPPSHYGQQPMRSNLPDAGRGPHGGSNDFGINNQQISGNQRFDQQQFLNSARGPYIRDDRIANFGLESDVGNTYHQSRQMEHPHLPPPTEHRSKSPERTGLTVSNRNKLQELVHSIRSTSTVDNEVMDSQTARSKAAVLAMLKNPSQSDRRAEDNYYKDRQGDYARGRTPELFVTDRREIRREPSPYSRGGRSPVRAKAYYSPERGFPSISRLPPPERSKRHSPNSKGISLERQLSSRRESRYSLERRSSPRRKSRYSPERRSSPRRLSPVEIIVVESRDYLERRPDSARASYRKSARSSPERMEENRRGRSPLKRRDHSPPRRTSPRKRSFSPYNQAKPFVEEKINTVAKTAKPLLKRLCPLVLDAGAREALTKKIEATWQKYYHKYYSCVATNPEIVLEMQKEYLRSYKGFFQEDPHFEFYYVKVAKPEDLREALTLRIDRGSPGPDPNDPTSRPYSESLNKSHLKGNGPRQDSWSPDRMNRPGNAQKRVKRSRSPHRRSPQRRSRSPRRRAKSPRRKSRSPRRRSRSPQGTHKVPRFQEAIATRSKQPLETRNDAKEGKPSNAPDTQTSSAINSKNNGQSIASATENFTSKRPGIIHIEQETDEVKRIATQLLNSAKTLSEMRKLPPPNDSNIQNKSSTLHKSILSTLPSPIVKNVQGGEMSTELIIISETESEGEQLRKAENNQESEKQPKKDSMKQPTGIFPSDNMGGMFPEKAKTSTTKDIKKKVEDRFQVREESSSKPRSENEPIITSTTQGFPVDRKRIQAKLETGKSGSVMARLGPRRKTRSSPVKNRQHSRDRHARDTYQLREQRLSKGRPSQQNERHRSRERRRISDEKRSHQPHSRSPAPRSEKGSRSVGAGLGQPEETNSFHEILSDPFLGFVHQTLTGIILIGQYQNSMATSTEPDELLARINAEQEDMHARMITDNGHLFIQLARCCIEDPNGIEKIFPNVNKDIGSILRNLDRKVISLIADTPIIIADPPKGY